MADLSIQLADASNPLTDNSLYSYFIKPVPASVDLFVTLYENPVHDVGLPCDKFSKYEMRQKLCVAKSGQTEAAVEESVVLFSQQSKDKEKEKEKKKRRDLPNITCHS